jgi:hypothetical protein
MQRIDRDVAEIARHQYGLITTAQLRGLPLSESSIAQRLAAGRLHRRFRGVYSVGHERLMRQGEWLAAVLASGPTAALSHRSASHHLELIRESPKSFVEVTASTRGRRAQAGVRLYETTRLPPDQFTTYKGIRTTSPARTIADLAAVAPKRQVERAIGRAEILYFLGVSELLDAARYRKGAPAIRAIIGEPGTTMTRSRLEDDFLSLIASAGLAAPRANERIAGMEVDFVWERQKLIVETDGDENHLARSARHRDRKRDAKLTALGYTVLRFGHEQVVGRPGEVTAAVWSALTGSAAKASPEATKTQRIA